MVIMLRGLYVGMCMMMKIYFGGRSFREKSLKFMHK